MAGRRAVVFYEWLMDSKLDLADAKTGNFINALDPKQCFSGPQAQSERHRVRDIVPGVRDFCPLVRRTARIVDYLSHQWRAEAQKATGQMHTDVLARATEFLLICGTHWLPLPAMTAGGRIHAIR